MQFRGGQVFDATMARLVTSVVIEPELKAALEVIAKAYAARGLRVGWTTILRRAAELGLPLVQREFEQP
jgi:hypothetical protein